MSSDILFHRVWAMPNPLTFQIKPIKDLLGRYIHKSSVVIDPFARDSDWGTFTNDINPATRAQYHMEALQFLDLLIKKKVKADVVIADPPYSVHQMKVAYQHFGTRGIQNAAFHKAIKDRLHVLLKRSGIAICFGWNSSGMGIGRGYKLHELLLVSHGGAHNDTIVTVERKL